MDEKAYKSTYRTVNENPCQFTKAILCRVCKCDRSQKVLLAEREVMACKSPGGSLRCAEVLETLRERSKFALGLTKIDEKLPHGKEIKIQVGAMLGLKKAITGEDHPDHVEDINQLIHQGLAKYGSLDQFPYGELVQSVTSYKQRQRAKQHSS